MPLVSPTPLPSLHLAGRGVTERTLTFEREGPAGGLEDCTSIEPVWKGHTSLVRPPHEVCRPSVLWEAAEIL